MHEFVTSSPVLGMAVTAGNLAIWLGLLSAITCVTFYWTAMLRQMRLPDLAEMAVPERKNGKGAKPAVEREDPRVAAAGVWARRFFYLTGACVIIGSLSLWTLIFSQQWNVHYVWKNTNIALPFGYRFAAFWSDQDGTFFLWALYNTILGSLLIRKAKLDERWVMPFFALINVSLFTLLTFMNPFWLHSAGEVKKQLTEMGATAEMLTFLPQDLGQHIAYYFGWGQYAKMTDGKGLNESLQNFWMVIHPPTLFVGYSSMIIPACFALGALMKKDYDTWVHRATPWLMFSWTILAFGIFLGAYWAYETLGWGGYWSWDPVENSSLIPWLVGTTLVHGMLSQRNRGNFKQANLFIGVMLGFSVLLGSFLVRSGVLGENSVHSFATPQKSVFITLLAIMTIWFVMGTGLWMWRYKHIQSEIAYETTWERHFGFFLGVIILSAISLVVMFGVTLPIWKPWLPGPMGGKGSVDFTFYNKALLPVCFVLVLLMGLTPLMPWKNTEKRPMKPFNRVVLWICALLGAYFCFAAYMAWAGSFKTQNDYAYIGFGAMMVVALVTNIVCLKRAAGGGSTKWEKLQNTGPWLAHIGFIVMLAGVVITSRFNTTHKFDKIEKGETVTALGKKFTFMGQKPASGPLDKDRMVIEYESNGKKTELLPKLFVSKQMDQAMAWPVILNEWFTPLFGDVYVEPNGVDTTGAVTVNELAKDAPEPADLHVKYKKDSPEEEVFVMFHGIDTSEMQREIRKMQSAEAGKKQAEPKPFHIYGDLTLVVGGVPKKVRVASKVSVGGGFSQEPVPYLIEGLNQPVPYRLHFKTNLNPSELKADIELRPDVPVYQGYFTVLHVPGIQILWWGVYLMVAGGVLTWRRRAQLARRPAPTPKVPTKPKPEPEFSREAIVEAEKELDGAE